MDKYLQCPTALQRQLHMSCSLNSLKGGYIGDYKGEGLLRGMLGV